MILTVIYNSNARSSYLIINYNNYLELLSLFIYIYILKTIIFFINCISVSYINK